MFFRPDAALNVKLAAKIIIISKNIAIHTVIWNSVCLSHGRSVMRCSNQENELSHAPMELLCELHTSCGHSPSVCCVL